MKDKQQIKEFIAKRVAKEFKDGDIVNLGIGLPTMVSHYIPHDVNVVFDSENGYTGAGQKPEEGKEDPYLIDAGGGAATIRPYGCFFGSDVSFGLIRGGHVDYTVLGALQVDEKGNLANYMIPGKMVPGMGGAMDLVSGAKHVIIAMEHTQKGNHKILKECTLPMTGRNCVSLIITEMGVMKPTEHGLELLELAEDVTIEEIKEATGCELIIPEDLPKMK